MWDELFLPDYDALQFRAGSRPLLHKGGDKGAAARQERQAKAQMKQSDRHHQALMEIQKAQLELASRPIPIPTPTPPPVTEMGADVDRAEDNARRRLLRKSGLRNVVGGAGVASALGKAPV